MDKFILYLVESSVILTFLYLLYVLLLRRETFFSLNRFFLVAIIILSMLFPLVSFDFNTKDVASIEQPIQKINTYRMSYYDALESWGSEGQKASTQEVDFTANDPINTSINWKDLLLRALMVVYLIGIVFCLSRTLWTIRWIWRLIASNPSHRIDEMRVVEISKPIAPFSFLNYVFVHAELVGNNGYDQILAHEKIHVSQWHSIDLIFVQLMAAFFWFNPVIWRLIKSLKTVHEFIADSNIINEGYSLVEYQTLLLRQLISNNSYGLVHNFNLSFIKKRITMMTNKKSGWSGIAKVALTIACATFFGCLLLQCNAVSKQQSIVGDTNQKLAKWDDSADQGKIEESNVIRLTIANNIITLQGDELSMDELPSQLNDSRHWQNQQVLARIDANANMGLVDSVFYEFRRFNVRNFVFEGRSLEGSTTNYLNMKLPPRKNFETGISWQNDVATNDGESFDGSYLVVTSLVSKEIVIKNDWPMLSLVSSVQKGWNSNRIDAWPPLEDIKNEVPGLDEKYPSIPLSGEMNTDIQEFVTYHATLGKSKSIVMFYHTDQTLFQEFITTNSKIRAGVLEYYENRAQEEFGKTYFELNAEESLKIRKEVSLLVMLNGERGARWTLDS